MRSAVNYDDLVFRLLIATEMKNQQQLASRIAHMPVLWSSSSSSQNVINNYCIALLSIALDSYLLVHFIQLHYYVSVQNVANLPNTSLSFYVLHRFVNTINFEEEEKKKDAKNLHQDNCSGLSRVSIQLSLLSDCKYRFICCWKWAAKNFIENKSARNQKKKKTNGTKNTLEIDECPSKM